MPSGPDPSLMFKSPFLADMEQVARYFLPAKLENRNDGQGRHWGRTARSKQEMLSVWKRVQHLGDNRLSNADPVFIHITRLYMPPQRPVDNDSILRGNVKQMLDAMVTEGLLADDHPGIVRGVFGDQLEFDSMKFLDEKHVTAITLYRVG